MLKLTNAYDPTMPVYVLASTIDMMFRSVQTIGWGLEPSVIGGTQIYCHGQGAFVTESPEQIMAMPEMQYVLYPAMRVQAIELAHSG